MRIIRARNVHQALPEGVYLLANEGEKMGSRAGEVIVAPFPVVTAYSCPRERVLFWPQRDANPFLHLAEGLWMIAGRNDVAWLSQFSSKIANFSTDAGAYGYRWRFHFNRDQLDQIVKLLVQYPESRRAVLEMWDAYQDLHSDEKTAPKDVPCNTHIYFRRRGIFLDMTVCCRSNDMIWGAYGTNAVHFSMLLEYMAKRIGCEIGMYYQLSNNFHAYTETFEKIVSLEREASSAAMIGGYRCPYSDMRVSTSTMILNPSVWESELGAVMSDEPLHYSYTEPFFEYIVKPMFEAHMAWRLRGDADRFLRAKRAIERMPADADWATAAYTWLNRREAEFIDRQNKDKP